MLKWNLASFALCFSILAFSQVGMANPGKSPIRERAATAKSFGFRLDAGFFLAGHSVGAALEYQPHTAGLLELETNVASYYNVYQTTHDKRTTQIAYKYQYYRWLYVKSGLGHTDLMVKETTSPGGCLKESPAVEEAPPTDTTEPAPVAALHFSSEDKSCSVHHFGYSGLTVPVGLGMRSVSRGGFVLDLEFIGLDIALEQEPEKDPVPGLRLFTLGMGYRF